MVRASGRRGFTLVELLVVVVLMAIILALLLPAIQKVRETSARMTCCGHLKEIAIAEQGHHVVRGYLTPGGTQTGSACAADAALATPALREAEWSWAYSLLPYLDRRTLYESADGAKVRGTPIKPFHCPTRRPAEAIAGLAKIDYAGNAGTHPDGIDGAIVRTGSPRATFASIADGLSSTVLFGEKRLNRAAFGRSSDDDESYGTPGWNGDGEVCRWGLSAPARDRDEPDSLAPSDNFGSAHTDGSNVAFCDGTVRFVRYGIDAATWQRLCVRNDGQVNRGNSW